MDLSKRAETVFAEVLQEAPQDRTRLVADACGSDKTLFDEVMSLLEAADESEGYFEQLSAKFGLPALSGDEPSLPAGTVIGHWRIERVLGRGGMGYVYLAARADEQFEQTAALKMLPIGLGTEAARARFLTERQILADLEHANIARLVDGGVTDEGTPYFVMDYVDGLPIDVYCDDRNLGIDARIRLFLGVLAAVSHAHAHLIVHRDIKPSNVLVDAAGNVKLLDFGIAKLLRPDPGRQNAGATRDIGIALTPEYAAPEQLLGQPVTTATDVYALGLMLYELLAGQRPRDMASTNSFAELVSVATRDPPKASTVASDAERRGTTDRSLRRALRGDLDNILRKAMAAEPGERYGTANDLASDLKRFLAGETVSAMPPTLGYRTQKFISRHRGGVVTTVLTLVALLASLFIATTQMLEAKKQRDIAVSQQQRVMASNEFLLLMMGEIGPEGEGLPLGELLDRGVEMLERSFGEDYPFLGRMYLDLSDGYYSLGKTDRMLDLLGRAEAFAREREDSDLLAAALCRSAKLEFRSEPERATARVVEANDVMAGIAAPTMDSYTSCARANADRFELAGDRQAAIDLLQSTLETLDVSPLASVHGRALVMNQLGNLFHSNGDREEGLAINARVLDLLETSGRGDTAGYMINALNRSVFLQSMGEVKNAFAIRKDLLERMRELKDAGRAPVSILSFYAASLMRLDRNSEALPIAMDALDDARAAGHEHWAAQDELQIARILTNLGRLDEAETWLDSAEASFRRATAANDRLIQAATFVRSDILLRRGDGDGARRVIDEELARLDYPAAKSAPGLATALRLSARIALAVGDADTAERHSSDAHELAVAAARDSRLSANVGDALLLRARARLLGDSADAARRDLQAAAEALANGLGDDNPRTQEARSLLATIR